MDRRDIILLSMCGIAMATVCGSSIYHGKKIREIEQKKVDNERLYFEKLTPEQVENLEKEKLEIKKSEIELKSKETELKKTVAEFRHNIQQEIESKVMTDIHDDMRDTFDTWSAKFETRLENKIDNVVSRIDNLSDKYGGVKEAGSSAPTISVVNAPNN